jgi:cell pole-organizing protein PopZ
MLRPMLQKWIDENMPRIVERALKRDPLLGPKTDA